VKIIRAVSLLLVFLSLSRAQEQKMYYRPFDTVHVYKSAEPSSEVVVLVSGDEGWNDGAIGLARLFTGMKATVAGVSGATYLRRVDASGEKCAYPAGDFELLSKFVQQELKFTSYRTPVIAGFGSGATLAYALIAQAPVGTFKGAISMGFLPAGLSLSTHPCTGSGLQLAPAPRGKRFSVLPDKNLAAPWIVLQGAVDKEYGPDSITRFVARTGNAEVTLLPGAGHAFAAGKEWAPQVRDAFAKIVSRDEALTPKPVSPDQADVSGLPLVEVPATGAAPRTDFAIILTGDGGWAGIDQGIADGLSKAGIPVVGWNSLQYYWTQRTPEGGSADLARIIRHYRSLWKKDKVVLVGYSFGADVLPFLAARLDKETAAAAEAIVFLGLAPKADFKFHVTGWAGGFSRDAVPTLPEIRKLKGKPMLYIYGTEEKETVTSAIDTSYVKVVALSGGHHYHGRFDIIARAVLSVTEKKPQ
jgi:type IV secretory pathway VirJ component